MGKHHTDAASHHDPLEKTPSSEEVSPQATDTQNEAPAGDVKASAEYQDLQNQYLRLAADFENFRKRQAQEREHLLKYGAQNTLEKLLPFIDNLERAQQSLSENSDPAMLYKSFHMLSQQILDALKESGLKQINPKGLPFDPEHHEALSQVENNEHPEHTILEVYQQGYSLHDRILRPAKVVVSVKNEASLTQPEAPFAQSGFSADVSGDPASNPFQQQSPSGSGSA